MVAVILMVAWFDFDRPRHARTWAASFALLAIIWILQLIAKGDAICHPGTAIAAVALGGLAAALNTIGFRQRAAKTVHAPVLLAGGLLPAALLFLLHDHLPEVLYLAPLDLIDAVMLALAADTLRGRRKSERAAQRVAFIGLLLLAVASFAMVMVRIGCFVINEADCVDRVGGIVLAIMPATITGVGLFTIFLLTADLADQTRRLAATDALTGLLNRRGFEEAAASLLRAAQASGRVATLALVDIDHFKSVNDSFGHQTGDRVIARFGRLLAAQTGRRDLLARMGGEEFAILMADTDITAAACAAEVMREEIGKTVFGLEDGRAITASFGLAELLPEVNQLSSLLSRADQALYRAKAAGRDRVMIFNREEVSI